MGSRDEEMSVSVKGSNTNSVALYVGGGSAYVCVWGG